jgi:hypothetical protein
MSNKDRYNRLKAAGLCTTCGVLPATPTCIRCESCISKQKVYDLARHWRNRIEVLTHYGGRCAVCGISNLQYLTIDHIDGNGADHREEVMGNRKTAGWNFYRWLKLNNYPPGFQVLCYNHNASKENHPKICNEPYLWGK